MARAPRDDLDAATDAELARRIAAGSGAGAEEAELCRRLAPRIRLYGLRHLRDEAAAADLVQEVLLVTLERLRAGEVRDPERFVSFVLGTCRMLVRSGRAGAGRRERLVAEYARTVESIAAPPAEGLDERRLEDCLARLGERERSVVVLTFWSGRSGEEIARDADLTPGNVRVIRHRALARLRECMEGDAA